MNQLLIDLLEDCLTRLEAGIPLDECLGDCIEYREELRELLITARAVRYLSVDDVPIGSIEKVRKKLSIPEQLGLASKLSVNPKLS